MGKRETPNNFCMVSEETLESICGESLGGPREYLAALGAPGDPEGYRKQLLQHISSTTQMFYKNVNIAKGS